MAERPKRSWKWKEKRARKAFEAVCRGSQGKKLPERPEESWNWKEKRARKAFEAVCRGS